MLPQRARRQLALSGDSLHANSVSGRSQGGDTVAFRNSKVVREDVRGSLELLGASNVCGGDQDEESQGWRRSSSDSVGAGPMHSGQMPAVGSLYCIQCDDGVYTALASSSLAQTSHHFLRPPQSHHASATGRDSGDTISVSRRPGHGGVGDRHRRDRAHGRCGAVGQGDRERAGCEVYQRSETAERTFERVDALVPIPSAQRNASDDGWVVHREDVEAAKANRASPTGQQRVREEMEELERNIDRRIFERQPVPDPRRGQVLFGAAAALAIALGCAVVHANLAAGSSGGSGGGGGVDAALVAAGMFGVVGAGLLVAGATMNSDSGTA
eukprot:ctg_1042.g390